MQQGTHTHTQHTESEGTVAHTYKTDPWHVKEARGVAWHPTQFAREHSPYTKAWRFLSAMVGCIDWDALYMACRADNAPALINVRKVA